MSQGTKNQEAVSTMTQRNLWDQNQIDTSYSSGKSKGNIDRTDINNVRSTYFYSAEVERGDTK